MSRRGRWLAFGSAGALVAGGVVCAIVLGGMLGALSAFVLIGSGLVLVTSLAFLEVGLSEERALERENRLRVGGDPKAAMRRRMMPARSLGRERAHRRTL